MFKTSNLPVGVHNFAYNEDDPFEKNKYVSVSVAVELSNTMGALDGLKGAELLITVCN